MLGSSDFVDSETTHEIPHIFPRVTMDFLEAAMITEDKQSAKLGSWPVES